MKVNLSPQPKSYSLRTAERGKAESLSTISMKSGHTRRIYGASGLAVQDLGNVGNVDP